MTNPSDAGAGSFRAAIEKANGDPSIESIVFRPALRPIALARPVAFTGGPSLDILGHGAVVDGGGLARRSASSCPGVNDAVHLVEALSTTDSVDEALEQWSERETDSARRLAALARQMDDAFVWQAPDFGTMPESDTADWWRASVTFPDDFRYVKDG